MRTTRMSRISAVGCAALFALLGMSACGERNSSQAIDAVQSSSTSDGEPDAQSRDDIVAKTLSGESFSLRQALAEKPVVLWFWAPG